MSLRPSESATKRLDEEPKQPAPLQERDFAGAGRFELVVDVMHRPGRVEHGSDLLRLGLDLVSRVVEAPLAWLRDEQLECVRIALKLQLTRTFAFSPSS